MAGMALLFLCAIGADDSGWRSTFGQPAPTAGRVARETPQAGSTNPLRSIVRPASAESAVGGVASDAQELWNRTGTTVRDGIDQLGRSVESGLERGIEQGERALESVDRWGQDLMGASSAPQTTGSSNLSTTNSPGPGGRMRRGDGNVAAPLPPYRSRTVNPRSASTPPLDVRTANDIRLTERALDPQRDTSTLPSQTRSERRRSLNAWLNDGADSGLSEDTFAEDATGRSSGVRPVRNRAVRRPATGPNYDLPIAGSGDLDTTRRSIEDEWGLSDSDPVVQSGPSYLDSLRTETPQMRRRQPNETMEPAPQPPADFARRAELIRQRTVLRNTPLDTQYTASDRDVVFEDGQSARDRGTYLNPPDRVRDDLVPVRRPQEDARVADAGRYPLPDSTSGQTQTPRSPSDGLADGIRDVANQTERVIDAAETALEDAGVEVKDSLVARPWWPLTLTIVGLFFSISFNAYLGWTAWDLYSRYQEVVEDVHELEKQLDTKRDESLLASSLGHRSSRPTAGAL